MQLAAHTFTPFRARLRALYYGRSQAGFLFQSALLAVDCAVLVYFLVTTFVPQATWMDWVDFSLGLLLLAEFLGRLLAHRHPMEYLDNASALLDLVVIASLLTAFLTENLSFLRILRTLRLLRSYQVLGRLGTRIPAVRRNEEIIAAGLNLFVFVMMFSSLVFVTQAPGNEKIQDFVDALYFTVAALSTTGFGDVTLIGSTSGELLSVVMMIVGISLFLRLVQAVFRQGGKVRFDCPRCRLDRHDHDAVHCKACGEIVAIPDHGD